MRTANRRIIGHGEASYNERIKNGVDELARSQGLGWIGIDVGTHTVKLAQAVRTPLGVRLHRAAVIQRSTSWSNDDTLAMDQPTSSRTELRAAFRAGGFSGRNAICLLPMNVCQLRGLHVPPGDDHERRLMIADGLAEEWSGQPHTIDFDYWELELGKPEKETETTNVNVLGVARPWVTQLTRDCQATGLDCWSIDGVPLAMARAVGLLGGTSGGRRALAVDWGFSNTTLCVVGDNRPLYVRRIHDCSFGSVLESIVREFGVTLDESQHLVESIGVPGAETDRGADQQIQAAIVDAANVALEGLVHQISRTLQFMDTQRRHLHPQAIWLMGGGASMRNIDSHLARALHVPVHIWKVKTDAEPIPCAARNRAAVFGNAVALSALAWSAA